MREIIEKQVEAFLVEFPDWRDVGSDDGQGLCVDASSDLVDFLRKAGQVKPTVVWICLEDGSGLDEAVFAFPPHPDYPVLGPADGVGDHAVVLWGDVVVDLTPRQFDENLPFPFIWNVEEKP